MFPFTAVATLYHEYINSTNHKANKCSTIFKRCKTSPAKESYVTRPGMLYFKVLLDGAHSWRYVLQHDFLLFSEIY